MTYRDQLQRLGDATAERVVAIVTSWTDGDLTHDEAVAVIAAVIAKANGQAVALADLSLAATLMLQLGKPVTTQGLLPPADDPARLTRAAITLLAIEGLTQERAARLGHSEPLTAAATAYSDAVRDNRLVTGWTRGLSDNACQLCEWWWREGRVWPDTHPMPTHKGCTCTPIPITERTPA